MKLPKVKSPTELVAGVLKQTGEFNKPKPGIHVLANTTLNGSATDGTMSIMGQMLMNPPTVEGWHTGHEWINSGTLSERISFVEDQFSDESKPGIKEIISRIGSLENDPSAIIDQCLDLMGGINVSESTYEALVAYTQELQGFTGKEISEGTGIHNVLQMVASTVDYQFA